MGAIVVSVTLAFAMFASYFVALIDQLGLLERFRSKQQSPTLSLSDSSLSSRGSVHASQGNVASKTFPQNSFTKAASNSAPQTTAGVRTSPPPGLESMRIEVKDELPFPMTLWWTFSYGCLGHLLRLIHEHRPTLGGSARRRSARVADIDRASAHPRPPTFWVWHSFSVLASGAIVVAFHPNNPLLALQLGVSAQVIIAQMLLKR